MVSRGEEIPVGVHRDAEYAEKKRGPEPCSDMEEHVLGSEISRGEEIPVGVHRDAEYAEK
jgi:hypothetical protein